MDIQPFEIGKYYKVPCVRAFLRGRYSSWPVLGPWHEDAEFVGFEDDHFHLDARFLSRDQYRLLCTERRLGEVNLFSVVITEYQIFEAVAIRLRKCHRPWPDCYPVERAKWLPDLQEAFASKTIGAGLICPHRGASLQGLTPDAAGCVTCPLHGLKWDCRTGSLVKHTPLAQPTKDVH